MVSSSIPNIMRLTTYNCLDRRN